MSNGSVAPLVNTKSPLRVPVIDDRPAVALYLPRDRQKLIAAKILNDGGQAAGRSSSSSSDRSCRVTRSRRSDHG